ncbi:MAG: CAP domain-containing protein [Bacteroidales bacterium]|jgi:uncharacterized protein YkwD|nr:CAP domain-containing protein [Bacteroidales bacterium]
MKVTAGLFMVLYLSVASLDECFAQEPMKISMLEEVNKLRRSGCFCGEDFMPPVPALEWNKKLELAATRHVKDMSVNDLSGHMGSNGSLPDDRITGAGYSWSMCGENVASGFYSVKDVVNGWRKSPGHCRNMMDADFREMGAARKGTFWVQNFGTDRPLTYK